jgi:uncharacterized protein
MISLVTPTFVMINRSRSVSLSALIPHLPEVIGLPSGGIISAAYGARLVHKLSNERLVRLIGFLRVGFGALLWEAVFPFRYASLVPASATVYLLAGIAIGGIGLVSSVLAVARGELLIQTLIFIFETDIRTAGSASILISLGIELMGLWRYRNRMRSLKADADSGLLAL